MVVELYNPVAESMGKLLGGEILRDFGKVLLPPTLALESYLTVLSITAAKYFFPSVSQFLRVLLENSFTKTFQDFFSTY